MLHQTDPTHGREFDPGALFDSMDGVTFDLDARRAVFGTRESALSYWRIFRDWHVYYMEGGFNVPLVPAEAAITKPQPRLLVVAGWEASKKGVGGQITFFCPSEDLARALTAELGQLELRDEVRGFFGLRVAPYFNFEEVLGYLCNLAGPDGIVLEW